MATPTLDLTGLPEPVVEDLRRLVETLRQRLAPQQPRRNIIGLFADRGIATPSLDEFREARDEM